MADTKFMAKVADIDFANSFETSAKKLIEMLGVVEPIAQAPGTLLKQYKITGTLSSTTYTEGSAIPVSTFTRSEVGTKEITLKPYRRNSTLQDIQKNGYERSVAQKDAEMLRLIQKGIKSDIITALKTGTATAEGTSFVAAAANAWAVLQNAMEDVEDSTPVFFANPIDFAKCIGDSEVFSAFGMSYIENWAGLGNLISTSTVESGNIYVTASGNMKVYYIDANGAEGFDFETDESGYIAVQHSAELINLTYETVAWTALTIFPEYVDFIVKAEIKEAATQAADTEPVAEG